jgi:hypothetical protein
VNWTLGRSVAVASVTRASRTTRRQPVRAGQDDVIPPPTSVTVWDDRPVLLWTHDERPIVRKAGF